ncbi:MAG TPA: DUF1579 family protein [Steroidobacteraceae bacterium]
MKFRNANFAVLLGLAVLSAAAGQERPPATDPSAVLERLLGEWQMRGDVRGTPVQYRLAGTRVLQGTFVELHMTDVARPAKYEARVFIGYDQQGKRVIAHWMDSFGAAYSIPHGVGAIEGNQIQFEIPYADGPFRDTFVYDRFRDVWTLNIESGDGKGSWRHFACYTITKRP